MTSTPRPHPHILTHTLFPLTLLSHCCLYTCAVDGRPVGGKGSPHFLVHGCIFRENL
uniref:ZP domain-containing protein n=1 Tax=Anguilla anguilla TaxID=7936 RepID=A0A0E9VYG3_ANGAN